jgi:hypothetical protein
MLQAIGEWYKLIDLDLTDDLLEKRRIAASALATDWTKLSADSAFEVVAFSIDIFSSDRKLKNSIRDDVLNAVRSAHPSFEPQSVTADADLKVCSAVALNELFVRQIERKSVLKSCVLPASCTASALRWRSTKSGLHVSQCMGSLLKSAEAILDTTDERRRLRKDLPSEKFKTSLAEEGTNLSNAGEAIDLLYSEMLKDREEIQALWWVFGGYSHLKKSAFQDLDESNAAVLAGCELAQIIKAPATFALASLCARATRVATKSTELASFEALLHAVDRDTWKFLDLTTRGESLVRKNPSIFPISFTAIRLSDDGDHTAADVVRTMPDWGTMDRTSAQVVAMQLFAERSLLAQIEDR